MDYHHLKSITQINERLILEWKTSKIESLLKSDQIEQDLLTAYENGLYNTPSEPKITPREMIYALTIANHGSAFVNEVKRHARHWKKMTTDTWNENVPPLYIIEIEYILEKL